MNRRLLSLTACALLAAGGAAAAADWPTLQQNNQRTGFTPEVIAPPYNEVWRRDIGEMIDVRVQPIVADGLVLVAAYKGLHALDASGGQPRWVFRPGGLFFSSPAVAGGRVYISNQDRNIYCVNLADGREIWRFQTGEGVWAAPTVEDGTVYVGSRDGIFYALSADTGREIWRFQTAGPILLTAAIGGEVVYFGSDDMNAYALNRRNGQLLWKRPLIGQSVRSYWPVVSDNFVYFRTLPVRSFWQHQFNVKVDTSNPDRLARVREWLEKDPYSKCFFAFDPRTGEETVFPVLWTAGGGTVPFPPVVLPGNRIATPAPAGERTASSGSSSLSIIYEKTQRSTPGYIRVIADESYGYSASGSIVFSGHHDYLQYVDVSLEPAQQRNTHTIIGTRDRPADGQSPQWFGNHDNHPGWHSPALANGHVYWIGQGSWLWAFKGESQ